MSDIRFEGWLHRSGTGGVYQDSAGNVGIASTQPQQKLDIGNGGFQVGPTGIATVTTVNTTNLVNSTPLSNRNYMVNGAMRVAQRGTGTFSGGTSTVRTVDNISSTVGGSYNFDVSMTQVTDAPHGFANALKVVPDSTSTPSGSDNGILQMCIEGQDLQDFEFGTSGAKPITVSFYAKSASTNSGDTYSVQIRHKSSSGTLLNYQVRGFTVTDSWQRFTFSFDGNQSKDIQNNADLGFQILWQLAVGPDDLISATTSWVNASGYRGLTGQNNFMDNTGNNFFVTGVQVELGSQATPFENRSFADELRRCQRYYFKFHPDDAGDTDSFCWAGKGAGSTGVDYNFILPCPLRASPTINLDTSGGGNVRATTGTSGNGTSTTNPTVSGFNIHYPFICLRQLGFSGMSDNVVSMVSLSSTGVFIEFTAEIN